MTQLRNIRRRPKKTTQLRNRRNFKKTQLFLTFCICSDIFVLTTQIEALTTQLQIMGRKLKQKRRNFEITVILRRRNFEADAERSDANRAISES